MTRCSLTAIAAALAYSANALIRVEDLSHLESLVGETRTNYTVVNFGTSENEAFSKVFE